MVDTTYGDPVYGTPVHTRLFTTLLSGSTRVGFLTGLNTPDFRIIDMKTTSNDS